MHALELNGMELRSIFANFNGKMLVGNNSDWVQGAPDSLNMLLEIGF